MNDFQELTENGSKTAEHLSLPRVDGSRIPFELYTSRENAHKRPSS
jgi:hypothetical protein